jgi:hypothetical protein
MLPAVKRSFLIMSAAALAVVASAGVAQAGSTGGPGSAGCGGSSCWGQVKVNLSGPAGPAAGAPNTGFAGVNVPPPPCWYGPPTYTPAAFWTQIVQGYVAKGPGSIGGEPNGWQNIIPIATSQHNGTSSTNGLWYSLDFNTPATVTPACAALDEWTWVPTGQAPPEPQINPQDLALLALSRVHLPNPAIRLNPKGASEVNLATFVIVGRAPRARANGQLYITATVPGQSVTVALTPKSVQIGSVAGGIAYNTCGPAGSKLTAAAMSQVGPGTPPDCGMLFQQASSTAAGSAYTVTQTWSATAYDGGYVAGETGNLLPNETVNSPTETLTVPVREIQSVNG